MTRLFFILLLAILTLRLESATREIKLPEGWQTSLDCYDSRISGFTENCLRTGTATFDGFIIAVYCDRASEAHLEALKARGGAKEVPALAPSDAVPIRVVTDPTVARKGYLGYLFRKRNVLALAPPGDRTAYIPLRRSIALGHELSHWAQRRTPKYTPAVCKLLDDFSVRGSDDAAYLFSAQEIEVRVADMHRLIFVLSGSTKQTPSQTRAWLAALGVKVVNPEQSAFGQSVIDRLRTSFSDAFELVDALGDRLDGPAEARRLALLKLVVEMNPCVL